MPIKRSQFNNWQYSWCCHLNPFNGSNPTQPCCASSRLKPLTFILEKLFDECRASHCYEIAVMRPLTPAGIKECDNSHPCGKLRRHAAIYGVNYRCRWGYWRADVFQEHKVLKWLFHYVLEMLCSPFLLALSGEDNTVLLLFLCFVYFALTLFQFCYSNTQEKSCSRTN